ncbi:MAG: histidine kinase [Alteromonadaceae bacterium]|nr:MAG: histidine kinase [Alteromonadaceae bacterium]
MTHPADTTRATVYLLSAVVVAFFTWRKLSKDQPINEQPKSGGMAYRMAALVFVIPMILIGVGNLAGSTYSVVVKRSNPDLLLGNTRSELQQNMPRSKTAPFWVMISEKAPEDFANIIRSATTGNFTVPAPELSSDPNGDEKAILNSVQKFTELRVKQRLSETLELPPLPESAQRIIKLRADPNADINDLTDVVEIDPSLAAQVVSWAASPYYSAPGKIRSVHDAIVRVLGFDMVLNLALGLALGKSLSMSAIKPSQIDQYWRSSVYTAAVIEGLVGKIPRDSRPTFGMAYLSGLLNNFGYLILAEVFPPYFESVSRLTSGNPHIPNAAIEQHLIGITGNQIASWLLDNWNMPEEVVTALRQQNNLQYDGEYKEYAKLIHLAKGLLANAGIGDSYGRNIDDVEIEALNLTRGAVTEVIENIVEASDDLDSIAEKMRG